MIKRKILIACVFISFLFVFVPFEQNAIATSIALSTGFEDGVLTQGYNNSWLHTYKSIGFMQISSSYVETGTKSYELGNGILAYFNLTYQNSFLMQSFVMSVDRPTYSSSPVEYDFYNKTLGFSTILIKIDSFSNYWRYYDYLGAFHNMGLSGEGYRQISFTITDNQSVTYFINSTSYPSTPYSILSGVNTKYYHIDTIRISGGVYTDYQFFDNLLLVSTDSFNQNSNPNGCSDFSGYSSLNHVSSTVSSVDGHTDPFVGFLSPSQLTGTLKGFEVIVTGQQLASDDTLSNYGLYINQQYLGTPTCYYSYDFYNFVLQWDITSYNYNVSNVDLTFRIGHSTTNAIKWYLSTNPNIFNDRSDYLITGVDLSGFTHKYVESPNWILYYRLSDNTSCYPNNNISFTDSNGVSLPIHSIFNKPYSMAFKTLFIDCQVNSSTLYTLSIVDLSTGLNVGLDQNFPRIIDQCDKQIGWTPYTVGNYTVSLHKTGYYYNKTIYISSSNTIFSVWGTPNPVNGHQTFTIGAHSNNPTAYTNYVIGIFSTSDSNNLINSLNSVYFNNFNGGFYYTDYTVLGAYDYVIIRLFGGNGTVFFPLTGNYVEVILSLHNANFIKTNLTNNVGVVGQHFLLSGQYQGLISQYAVYKGSDLIYDGGGNTFFIEQTIMTTGTYTYHLKEWKNSAWSEVASVTVSITNGNSNPLGFSLSPPVSYIVAIAIIIILMIIPIILSNFIHSDNSTVITVISFILAIVGLIVDILLGFLPAWVFAGFVIAMALIVLFLYLSKRRSE